MYVGFPHRYLMKKKKKKIHAYETSPQNVKANENEHQNVLIICAVRCGEESICVETGKRSNIYIPYTYMYKYSRYSEFSCLWYMSPTNLPECFVVGIPRYMCGLICVCMIYVRRTSYNENAVKRKISLILYRRTFSSLRKIHVRAQLSSKRGDNEPIRYV